MIIALGHRRNVGKDAFGRAMHMQLQNTYGKRLVFLVSFADKLKSSASFLFEWAGVRPRAYYDNYRSQKEAMVPPLGMTYRDLLIKMGLAMREIHPDIWVNAAFQGYDPNKHIYIVTDLRFPNEAEKVKELGGKLVRVDRDSVEKFDDPADSALADYHGWDLIVKNNGPIADLVGHADKVLEFFGVTNDRS